MAKLSADEQKLLDELTARAAAPDADEQFEIEVYDTEKGKGARIPFAQGKNWLFETFGIGQAPEPAAGEGEGAGAAGEGEGAGGRRTGSGGSFFGRK